MKHEFHKKKYFKNQLRLLAAAFVLAPAAVMALGLLCLGRGLLAQAREEAPLLSVELPLAAPMEEGTEAEAAPEETEAQPEETDTTAAGETAQADGQGTALFDQSVTLTVEIGDTVQELTLGDYLWGVVAAEMPASFEEEALKAQAVAARTYTVYKLLHPTGAHEADLCSDTGCCQAWISVEDRMEKWGEDAETLAAKVTQV